MKERSPITAAELMARQQSDPDYRKMTAEKAQRRALRKSRLERVEQPLMAELEDLGYKARSVHEIAKRYAPLPPLVVQTLLQWLPRVEDDRIKESIVRALVVAAERFDGRPLIACFERASSETSLRWAIANTMAEAKPLCITDWLLEAVKNPLCGTARQMLVLALARLAPPGTSLPVLVPLLHQLPGHVATALGEIGTPTELVALRSQLDRVDRKWEQQAIKKAIRKIEARSR